MTYLIVWCVVWFGSAAYLLKHRASVVTSIGGGFILGCVSLVPLAYLLGDKPSVQHTEAPPPAPAEIVSNSPWNGSVYQVEEWLKANLKDPGSLEIIEWRKVARDGSSYVVSVKYRAKNSFGGYVVDDKLFFLDTAGRVTSSMDAPR